MRNPPKDAIVINTTGRMWQWEFTYPNLKSSDTLFIPVNKPIKLNLRSVDVIHSLYIPAFRVKEDVVPGKDNYIWFIAKEKGIFDISCAAYCGLRHSYMQTKTIVMDEKEYNMWLTKNVKPQTKDFEGLTILKKNACIDCHSIDGKELLGPTFKGIYGSSVKVTVDGKTILMNVDDNYIKSSIFKPDAGIVDGYPANVMQSYQGKISEDDVKKIIEYLKSIK